MDEELRAYLDAMEGRTRSDMAAMEARLMGRINDVQERMLQGFAGADKRMSNLELAVVSVAEQQRSTNILLNMIATSHSDLTGRITRLENKP